MCSWSLDYYYYYRYFNTAIEQNIFNSRKGQRTNQKYRNLVGSDQQMQGLEETELRKADRTVGVQQILQCLKITYERLPLVRGPIGDSLCYLDTDADT